MALLRCCLPEGQGENVYEALQKLEQNVFPNINRTQAAEIDLDLQTRPSEGPNTSSARICRKSVQRFPFKGSHLTSHLRHSAADWSTTCAGIRRCDGACARRLDVGAPCHSLQRQASLHVASRVAAVVADVAMSREQRCLLYSIDAILGLTGNGQRSASTTIGHRKCRDSSDAAELQPNAATSHHGSSGIT